MKFIGHGNAVITGGIDVGASPDGGKNITGWTVFAPANCTGCTEIWRAPTPVGVDSRQFYVNGERCCLNVHVDPMGFCVLMHVHFGGYGGWVGVNATHTHTHY